MSGLTFRFICMAFTDCCLIVSVCLIAVELRRRNK